MPKLLKTLILILTFLCLPRFAFSQEAVNISFTPNSAFLGDIIVLKIKAELPQGAYINNSQKFSFSSFDILDFEITHLGGAKNIYEIDIKIAGYKIGVLPIESQTVFYIEADGSNNMFFTPASSFEIKSISNLSANMPVADGIRDIKPLRKLPIKTIYLVLIILFFALFIVGIFIIRREFLKSKNKKESLILDPKTAALQNLAALYKSGLSKTDARLFYYKMSEIFRVYISKQYNFNAMEMTLTEIFESVKTILPSSININDFKSYLKVFVLAQYAGFKPDEKEIKRSFSFTEELLTKL